MYTYSYIDIRVKKIVFAWVWDCFKIHLPFPSQGLPAQARQRLQERSHMTRGHERGMGVAGMIINEDHSQIATFIGGKKWLVYDLVLPTKKGVDPGCTIKLS